MLHLAIDELRKEGYKLSSLCKIAGISRQAHHKFIAQDVLTRVQEDRELCYKIVQTYYENDGVYGYRQMTYALNNKFKTTYSTKTIYKWMRLLGLKSVTRPKKKTYDVIKPEQIKDNLLNRKFNVSTPDAVWVTDITEFDTRQGKVKLCAILDLATRRIVAWNFADHERVSLVRETFEKALKAHPGVTPLVHSDRGIQYTSTAFRILLEAYELDHSMSRAGNCLDNAAMESFWGKLKSERYYLKKRVRPYRTKEELIKDITDYIIHYNNDRPHGGLGGMTPMQYYLLTA